MRQIQRLGVLVEVLNETGVVWHSSDYSAKMKKMNVMATRIVASLQYLLVLVMLLVQRGCGFNSLQALG